MRAGEDVAGPEALGGAVFERKKAGGRTLPGCNFGNAAKVGLYAKFPCFLTVSRGNCFSCAFGKDEVTSSNLVSSSSETLEPQGLIVTSNYLPQRAA